MSNHTLTTTTPFEFAHSLEFLRGFGPTLGEQLTDDVLIKAVRILGRTVLFTVQVGARSGTLRCALSADQPLSAEVEAAVLSRVRFYLGLDDEVQAFYQLAAVDRAFQPVLRALRGYHQVKFFTPFENAAWAILTQRTRTPGARSLKSRLTRAYGGELEGRWAFPEASDLAEVPEHELADTLGNARKATYLSGTARAFAHVDDTWLRTAPHTDVLAWLLSLPGIGPWSALFVLMRGLGRGDHLFEFDGHNEGFLREIGQAAEPYYGPLNELDLRQIAEHYGPWQGYWMNYLRAAVTVEKTMA
jgi:DNA-3-methyladenine glycosylase II